MVGLGELLARLERRRQLLAAEGLFARELKRSLPFLPHRVGLVTAPESAAERDVLENARRRWPNVAFEVAYATMQGQRAAAEVIEALARLDRHPDVDVIVVARGGGVGRGPAAVLRRGAGPGRAPAAHPGGLGDRPRAGPAPARPGRRRPGLHADRRRQAGGPRRRRGAAARVRRPPAAPAACSAGWLAREQAGLDALRSRPVLADPRGAARRARRRGPRAAATAPAATLGHRLDRADDDIAHQRARARALSPLATLERGYAVLQDAEGHVLTSVAGRAGASRISVRVADGRVHATTTRTERLEETTDD